MTHSETPVARYLRKCGLLKEPPPDWEKIERLGPFELQENAPNPPCHR